MANLKNVVTINNNEELFNEMYSTQEAIELGSRREGITKTNKRHEELIKRGDESHTDYGHCLIAGGLERFAVGIQDWFSEDTSKGGHSVKTLNLVKEQKPTEVAFLFMQSIIGSISNHNMKLTNALTSGALAIDEQAMLSFLRNQDKAFCKRVIDASNKRTGYQKAKVMDAAMNDAALKGKIKAWVHWSEADKLRLGGKLLEIMMDTVGLVEIDTETRIVNKKLRTQKFLRASEDTMKWIEDRKDKTGLTAPVYKPLVVPPRDWNYDNLENGVFYTLNCRPVKLVKTAAKKFYEELSNTDIPVVLHAVNAMQRTPMRINMIMLNLIDDFWQSGVTWCPSIPAEYGEPTPPREDITDWPADKRAEYWSNFHRVEVNNRENASKRASFYAGLKLAHEYKDFSQIFFGYQLDFRGRIYPINGILNGQGPDEMKALLEFAEGKPLGKSGSRYLAIHLANLGDFDKVSKQTLDKRVKWVHDNEALIRAVVANPWDNRVWIEADSPLQFVAACHDWVGYLDNGENHVSHTVTALDGSCSGLQHLSMAMKCAETAANVNILPNEVPQDIYQIVADKVSQKLLEDSQKPEDSWEKKFNNIGTKVPNHGELAREWLKFGRL